MDANIQKLFDNAKNIVFLTGAGVSTASGIPDFRSANGLYSTHKAQGHSPEWYLSHDCLMNHPKTFYKFAKQNLYHPNAKPNIIHKVQAKLTRMGKAYVITQNIDGLYLKAHTEPSRLIQYHGTMYKCHCLKCGKPISWKQYLKSPIHKADGGQIRPNVVLYGEGMNETDMYRSVEMMRKSDLIVIVGTAMTVGPFNMLPMEASANTPVIVINEQDIGMIPTRRQYKMIKMDATKFFRDLKI